MSGSGFATTLCAVLSGVSPDKLLIDDPDMSEPPRPDSPTVISSVHHRMLSYHVVNNTNTTGLEPGAIVGISIGAVLIVIILVIAAYYLWSRSRSSDLPRSYSGYAPTPQYSLPPMQGGSSSSIFANLAVGEPELGTFESSRTGPQLETDLVGMPLLNFNSKRP